MLLVVGNAATVDALFCAEDVPAPQDVGVLVPADRSWYAGGSAAAIAIAAAATRAKVRLWHPLPRPRLSPAADELLESLRIAGIDTAGCPVVDHEVRAVIVDAPGGRIAWSDPPAHVVVSDEQIAALLVDIGHVIFAPRWGDTSERILAQARRLGIPVSIVGEAPPAPGAWAVAVADHRQLAVTRTGEIAVEVATRGADGADIRAAGESIHIPAELIIPVDTTGAGDAFGGTFIGALIGGATAESAGRHAAAAAAAACRHPGAIRSHPQSRKGRRPRHA